MSRLKRHLCSVLLFPNAKINLGLRVLRKRPDGYRDISTVMFPVKGLHDALEFVPAPSGSRDSFILSGNKVPGAPADNICLKALALLRRERKIPPLDIYLHKAIPAGAGLGGGSADGTFFLTGLNEAFSLGYGDGELEARAAELGSDCAFFVKNIPAKSVGRGEILSPLEVPLSGMHLAVARKDIHIATGPAYAKIRPDASGPEPAEIVTETPVSEWKDHLTNDFEAGAFSEFPELRALRDAFYTEGAVYAAMTGSGSAVFGIFTEVPEKRPATLESQDYYGVFSL